MIKMSCFLLFLLTALDLTLVVWGAGERYPSIVPELPPPPTYSPVVNNSLFVAIGQDATVRLGAQITVNCTKLIDDLRTKGEPNPTVTWTKDGIVLTNASVADVFVSEDKALLIITRITIATGGQLGNDGNYSCRACGGDGTADCDRNTSCLKACGEPNIRPPQSDPIVFPSFISLTCGNDVTTETLESYTVSFACEIFNGSEPFTLKVYKDGELTDKTFNSFDIAPATNSDFGTYAFMIDSENCGAAIAVSILLQEGDVPDIDEGPVVPRLNETTRENKRVKIGTDVYVINGYDVTIDCNASGTPPITYSWLLNGTEFRGNDSTITITDATYGDVITCRANNSIGFDEESTTIYVESENITLSFGSQTYSVDEDAGTLQATLKLSNSLPKDITIQVVNTDGSAISDDSGSGSALFPDADYTAGPYIVTFPAGSRTASVIVPINDDDLVERDENFTLSIDLSSLPIGITTGINNQTLVTINDNDNRTIKFEQSIYDVNEFDGFLQLVLLIDGPILFPVPIQVIGTDRSATRGATKDYDFSEFYTVEANTTKFSFNVSINDDNIFEGNENFTLTINASLPFILDEDNETTVNILDDDPIDIFFNESTYSVNESSGNVQVALVLSNPSSTDITVQVTSKNDTATGAGTDFDSGPFDIIFLAGETSVMFNASIIQDNMLESDESFTLLIDPSSLPNGVTVANPNQTTVTIIDNTNECLIDNGGCAHMCMDTLDSFKCSCRSPFQLAANNKTCVLNVTDCFFIEESYKSGRITTFGFPNTPYAPNSNCTWIVDLPGCKSVELKFDEVDIEESPNCAKDRVTLLNGNDVDAIPMGSYCGNKVPDPMNSSTEVLAIQFISDGAINNKGFNLQYRGLKERTEGVFKCPLLPRTSTTIGLSTFPSKYNESFICQYTFNGFLFQKVKLTFLYLDIVNADCNEDKIEIYDNAVTAGTPDAMICNGKKMVEFTSKGSIVRMVYTGNSVDKYRGFLADVKYFFK